MDTLDRISRDFTSPTNADCYFVDVISLYGHHYSNPCTDFKRDVLKKP